MSILRQTAFRLPALRATSIRFASTASTQGPITPEAAKWMESATIKHDAVAPGTKAFYLPIPDQLPETDFLKRRKAVEAHSVQTTDLWRKISYYVCLPALIVCGIYVYKLEAEHEEHLQHIIDENGGSPPERKVYSYMNMRTKPFPWGQESLFYNPRYNIPASSEE